jgi:uncharacterized protein YoxC
MSYAIEALTGHRDHLMSETSHLVEHVEGLRASIQKAEADIAAYGAKIEAINSALADLAVSA